MESLRALAALSVLVSHVIGATLALGSAAPTAASLNVGQRLLYGGGFGVFFFFGLTGYLLFWPFARQHFGDGDSIDLRRYAVNRAVRILPLYYVVVVVVLLVQFPDATLGVWARFLTFTENFSVGTAGQFVGTAWSLVVELQFYLLLPLLAYGIGRLAAGSRRRAAVWILALGVASLTARAVTIYFHSGPNPLWRFNMPATFVFFVPGMLLALVRVEWERHRPPWLRGWLARGDLWLLAAVPLWAVVALWSYHLDFLLCLGSFLVIGACVLPLSAGRVTRSLDWRVLTTIGVASYSLYLWHVPVIRELVNHSVVPATLLKLGAVAIPISIVVALLSYAGVESPFLRLRRQWARSSAPVEPTAGRVAGQPRESHGNP